MKQKRPAAALFDLDGVIVDTEPQYTDFWKTVGMRYFPEDRNFSNKIKGQTLKGIFSSYFPEDEDVQKEIVSRLNAFEAGMSYPYVPGILPFLDALRAADWKVAIVTSSNKLKMQHVYRACPELLQKTDRIFTAEDATRSKPAPDCYVHAARSLGFSPENCIVFEDSLNGLLAARRSGAKVIGLTTSNPIDIVRPMCDFVWPDFMHAAVEQLLDGRNAQ